MKKAPKPGDYVNLRKEKSGNLIDFLDANENRIFLPIKFGTAIGKYTSTETIALLEDEGFWFMVFCPDWNFHFARTPSGGRELSLSDLLGDEEVVWDGEGWPPVGTKCEFHWHENKWVIGEVMAIVTDNGCKSAVIQLDNEWRSDSNPKSLRPIKSEREIAVGEMFDASRHLPVAHGGIEVICQTLFDAGYRKIKDAEK